MNAVLPRVLCCALLLLSTHALANDATHGAIVGTVIEAGTNMTLAEVKITLSSPALVGPRVTKTDLNGQYAFLSVPPGDYLLEFELEGIKPLRRRLTVRQGETSRLNVTWQVQDSFEESMVVSGASSPRIDLGAAGRAIGGFFKSLVGADKSRVQAVAIPLSTKSPIHVAPPPPERTALPPHEPFVDMFFKNYGVNPTIDTEEERFSTFSVDVDRASYALARGFLERGALPDEAAVRVEEFVNTFDYGYPDDTNAPFRVHVEGFPSPSRKGYHVVHIGLKAREVSRAERKPAHLVFVIDVSGSMDVENRLGLVKRALHLLVDELDERDQVSLVVYGSTAHQVLEPTRATHKPRIYSAIDGLRPEGSTNAQAGIELGYRIAAEHLVEGINRVILCSDGVANNGITHADGIWEQVRERAARGITLTTVGFGMGNYNDVLMERLAQVGEGQYAYVDELEEARRLFVENLTGTLQVVAKDVKVQVEFDREAVALYRLIGYENRMLTKEQFANDRVDAGEVGAGHTVTALYEVKLREPRASFATLRIRYKAPEGGESRLIEKTLPASVLRTAYGRTAPPTRLSWVAAAFAEKLRGSYWVRPLSWRRLHTYWEEVGEGLRERPDVMELGALIRKAWALDQREDRFEKFAPVSTMDFDRVPVIK